MDLPLESASIKVEPGSQDGAGGEMKYTDKNIDLPDVKKECLQYAESAQTTSKLHFNIKKMLIVKFKSGVR